MKRALAAPLILLAACVTKSRPLDVVSTATGYRYRTLAPSPQNSESLFVVLTFSGGGTRAAALAHGVLDELRFTKIRWEGHESTLLDEVDVIAAVSGGSLTAAHYALWREKHFDRFKKNFLQRRPGWHLWARAATPHRFLHLVLSRRYNRSELATDYWNLSLFKGATFKDLAEKPRPFLIINAADLSQSSSFEFTQNQFDLICADLSTLPIARAVAASSAFPVLLSPVQIQNHANRCKPDETYLRLAEEADKTLNPARYAKARTLLSYRNAALRPYINLVDGGFADNLGAHCIVDALNKDLSAFDVPPPVHEGLKKLVVIIVDAKTVGGLDMDQTSRPPGFITTIAASAGASVATVSAQRIDMLRMKMNDLRDEQVNTYLIHISFDELVDPKDAKYYKAMPTNFSLAPRAADRVVEAGRVILREHLEFKRLVKDLQP